MDIYFVATWAGEFHARKILYKARMFSPNIGHLARDGQLREKYRLRLNILLKEFLQQHMGARFKYDDEYFEEEDVIDIQIITLGNDGIFFYLDEKHPAVFRRAINVEDARGVRPTFALPGQKMFGGDIETKKDIRMFNDAVRIAPDLRQIYKKQVT